MKQFLICFEWRGDVPNSVFTDFHTYITGISNKQMHVLNGVYIIQTEFEKEIIQEELLKLASRNEMIESGAKLLYFIIEISDERKSVCGYIFKSFWEFFK